MTTNEEAKPVSDEAERDHDRTSTTRVLKLELLGLNDKHPPKIRAFRTEGQDTVAFSVTPGVSVDFRPVTDLLASREDVHRFAEALADMTAHPTALRDVAVREEQAQPASESWFSPEPATLINAAANAPLPDGVNGYWEQRREAIDLIEGAALAGRTWQKRLGDWDSPGLRGMGDRIEHVLELCAEMRDCLAQAMGGR